MIVWKIYLLSNMASFWVSMLDFKGVHHRKHGSPKNGRKRRFRLWKASFFRFQLLVLGGGLGFCVVFFWVLVTRGGYIFKVVVPLNNSAENRYALPDTNVFAPKNGWLEYKPFLLGKTAYFQGQKAVRFRVTVTFLSRSTVNFSKMDRQVGLDGPLVV